MSGKKILIICIVVYLCTVLFAGLCHMEIYNCFSKGEVSVQCTEKVDSVSSGYKKHEESKIYFELINDGEAEIEKVEGVVTIAKKSSGKELFRKEVSISNGSSSAPIIEGNSKYEFYIYLYDKSIDRGGIENFDTIYSTKLSDLNVKYEISSIEYAENTSGGLYFLSVILTIPTYLLGILSATAAFIGVFLGVNSIPDMRIRIIMIIISFPLYIFGLLILLCGHSDKKTFKGKVVVENDKYIVIKKEK